MRIATAACHLSAQLLFVFVVLLQTREEEAERKWVFWDFTIERYARSCKFHKDKEKAVLIFDFGNSNHIIRLYIIYNLFFETNKYYLFKKREWIWREGYNGKTIHLTFWGPYFDWPYCWQVEWLVHVEEENDKEWGSMGLSVGPIEIDMMTCHKIKDCLARSFNLPSISTFFFFNF